MFTNSSMSIYLFFENNRIFINSTLIILLLLLLINSMAYGTWRFNAAFTRALQ